MRIFIRSYGISKILDRNRPCCDFLIRSLCFKEMFMTRIFFPFLLSDWILSFNTSVRSYGILMESQNLVVDSSVLLLILLYIFLKERDERSLITWPRWMLIQTHQHIQPSSTGYQCLSWVMSFITLAGTLAALAMVMLPPIDVFSSYHPLCKTSFSFYKSFITDFWNLFKFNLSLCLNKDLVASMRSTQRQTRGHLLCTSTWILKRLLIRLDWLIHTQLIVLPLAKSWCPVLETKRETPRGMGFFFSTLISTSRAGGRKKDIVPCSVMTSGINRGTRRW